MYKGAVVRRKSDLADKVVTGGERITREEAREMWNLFEFTELATTSQAVRFRQNPGNDVTYLIDRNINYTNVCNSDYSFCDFSRHNPHDPEPHVLSRETMTEMVQEAKDLGATRILLQDGAGAGEYPTNAAFSRIFLDNIQHHQSSWPTCGAHVAEIGLHAGCDDIGSTMMEEDVVSQAAAPTASKWSMSPEELEMHIRQAGFNTGATRQRFQCS